MNAPSLPLELTGLEVVYLTDSIANGDTAQGLPDKDAYVPLAREALLLLGSAYIEVMGDDAVKPGPISLQVSEEVAWLLRGKVKTGSLAIDGTTVIGPGLLCKLYKLLLSFNANVDWLPVTGVDRDMDALDKLAVRLYEESE